MMTFIRLAVALTISPLFLWADEAKLQQTMEEQKQNHQRAVKSQKTISSLADKTGDLKAQYRITLGQIEDTRAYNNQLKQLIKDQQQSMLSIREQIVEVKKTGKEIVPLMLKMLETLEKFIQNDVPFLQEERTTRLKKIKSIMNRSDVSVSEKYRKIIEAYQQENEYGKTIEAYQGLQKIKDRQVYVNYLKIGRLVLIYQTLDQNKQAYWDQKQRTWKKLPSRYTKAVEEGLKVARHQMAPALLTVPVPPPQTNKGNL